MVTELALSDEEVLDEVDLPALLPLPAVHLVEPPPRVGPAGRQVATPQLNVT